MKFEIRIFVSGKVQGVGFRSAIYKIAQKFNLKGYVRNLKDGRVEILAQGEKSFVEQFHSSLKNSQDFQIEHLDVEWDKVKKLLGSFEIIF